VQVDDAIVELRLGEVEPDAAQVGADVCFPGELPLTGLSHVLAGVRLLYPRHLIYSVRSFNTAAFFSQ
jgi:hypothetical protein